jgi:transcription elongation factor GreB
VSKAFTKEDEGGEELLPEPRQVLPPSVKNYVTPQGAERLRRELQRLVEEERPRVASALSTGGSEARQRLHALDRRIALFRDRVAAMEVVEPTRQDPGRVRFGATVRVADLEGYERSYQIVGVDESDPTSGKVSWLSPIARALLGKKSGEVAKVELPDGPAELEILEIRYTGG